MSALQTHTQSLQAAKLAAGKATGPAAGGKGGGGAAAGGGAATAKGGATAAPGLAAAARRRSGELAAGHDKCEFI